MSRGRIPTYLRRQMNDLMALFCQAVIAVQLTNWSYIKIGSPTHQCTSHFINVTIDDGIGRWCQIL
jgi:hypothetical protein